jgi:hypothetical protein
MSSTDPTRNLSPSRFSEVRRCLSHLIDQVNAEFLIVIMHAP